MKYILDIDELTGLGTLQIGDLPPVKVTAFDVRSERETVMIDERNGEPLAFVEHEYGETGRFTLDARLDYLSAVNNPKI